MSTNTQRLTYYQKKKDIILKKAKEYYQKIEKTNRIFKKQVSQYVC